MSMRGDQMTCRSVFFMKMPSAVVLVQICMFVLLISRPTSVKCNVNPPMSSFELYQQEVVGDTTSDNTVIITNSPLGFLGVEAQPLTSGASNTSTRVGTVYGTASEKGSGTSNEFVFLVLDFHVDGSFVIDGKSKYVNGTFIVVGAADLFQPTRNLPILGGTGDFLAAKGFVVQSYASGDVTSNVTSIKSEVMYWN